MFLKKPAQKLIFDPQITLRAVCCSDTAQNQNFCAEFLNARFYSVVSFSATEEILNCYMGEAGGA
jgi:hypothetical protein